MTQFHQVPEPFIGLWRRSSLIDECGVEDRTTEVYWLQTHSLYVDLRLPTGRPDFYGCADLHDLTAEQIEWLVTQQGFAGVLEVEHDLCIWHRWLDFQPPGALADIGRVEVRGDIMTERGVVANYTEEWLHTATGAGGTFAAKLVPGPMHTANRSWPKALLIVVGNHFMHARARTLMLPQASTLAQIVEQGTQPPSALLDCVIDFGVRQGESAPWEVLRSTMPWREGRSLFTEAVPMLPGDGTMRVLSTSGLQQRWRVVEMSPDFIGF